MGRLWVARLYVSDRTRAKISSKHGLDVDDVRAHLVAVRGLEYRVDDDPERGLRVVIVMSLRGQRVAAVLYPAPDLGADCYRLGSAYRV